MPVLITTVLPPEATLELVLGIENQLPQVCPESFIAHVTTYDESIQRVRMFDLWDSVEARDAYFTQNVLPVIRRETAKVGIDNPTPESSSVSEVVLLLTGARARTPS
jgi:hypothetical protein